MNFKRIGLSLIALSALVLAGCTSSNNAADDTMALAKCMTQKGAVFYGTERCPHCQAQKALFGPALNEIDYVDCDREADKCKLANIQGYPTWVFSDGSRGEGTQPLADLAAKTGCPYNTAPVAEGATETTTTTK